MPSRSTVSASPAPTAKNQYNKLADALYQWCVDNADVGTVFQQDQLLNSNIIPSRDANILLGAVAHLTKSRLFKVHEIKGSNNAAWELVSQENAANYDDLSRDEQMVYSYIESAGAAGIWTKTIRAKTQLHAKIVEKSYKSLETKGLVKQMKNVKNPGRKMYILSSLKPNEEATGGTWYTNDELDEALLDNVATAIEVHVSRNSWLQVDISELVEPRGQKRKTPMGGFDIMGKGKARAGSSAEHEVDRHDKARQKGSAKPHPPSYAFQRHPANYQQYPTVFDITKAMNDLKVAFTILPVNAISRLLEVMVLDEKLVKCYRLPTPGNIAEEQEAENADNNLVTMYRHLTKPDELRAKFKIRADAAKGTAEAVRVLELEDIGRGGSTEVPCLRCPVFDICEDGGPVNARTCTYWAEFETKMQEADAEAEAREKAVYLLD